MDLFCYSVHRYVLQYCLVKVTKFAPSQDTKKTEKNMIEHAASIVFSQSRGSIMNDDEMESSQWDYVAAPPKPAFMIHYRGSEAPPAARDGRRVCV